MPDECKGNAVPFQSPAEIESRQWQVTVRVPMRLPATMRESLDDRIAATVSEWQPDDRDGWDAAVSSGAAAGTSMYERAYFDVQKVLDEALGTEEEDGAGGGIAGDVWLLAEKFRTVAWLHAEAAFERDTTLANFEAALADKDRVIQRMAVWRDRWMDAWHATHAEWWKSQLEIDRLRREVEFWGNADPLTDGHAGSRDNLRYPLCACISDDQAASLGPGFSRPVCAVHPTPSDLQVPPSLGATGRPKPDWCNCQAVKGTASYPGPWHPPGNFGGPCIANVGREPGPDPGDGRVVCPGCNRWKFLVLHSCPNRNFVLGEWRSGTPWAEGGEPND